LLLQLSPQLLHNLALLPLLSIEHYIQHYIQYRKIFTST
jgi:hypothetical protein